MVKNMLQKIAEICIVITFVSGIYTSLVDNPEWQSYLFFGLAFLCFIFWLIDRKLKLRITGKVVTLRGTQPLPYPHRMIEVKVFYPKPFECIPNLNIHFRKIKLRSIGLGPGDEPSEPEYKITEQRSDGFKIEVLSFTKGAYKPIIEWQAKGQPKE